MRLRDAAEEVIRSWDAHERGRGARPVVDFDFAPPSEPVQPAESRLDVHEQLVKLVETAEAEGDETLRQALTAHLTYVRALLGERLPIEEYIERTQGCAATGWSPDYVASVGDRARAALSDLGIAWGPDTQKDFDRLEGYIDLNDAKAQVEAIALEDEPRVRELAGTQAPYSVSIEVVDVDDYWAYWLDGAGSEVRLRFNLRQAVFTANRLRQFAQHELLGHALQCASYSYQAAHNDVPWLRLSSVHLPYQVCLEGLATALPLFVSPGDAQLVARTRLDHYIHLIRAQLHLDINRGTSPTTCADLAREHLPFWNSNEISNELSDRATDPMLRTYLWSYPAGTDWFVRLADATESRVSTVLRSAYECPMSPQDLEATKLIGYGVIR